MINTIKGVTAGTAALALTSMTLGQSGDPFRAELHADYITHDNDTEDIDFNEDNLSLGATIYLSPVIMDSKPLKEQPFISRASNLDLRFDVQELDDSLENTIDLDTYRLGATIISKDSGFYGKLGYVNSDADFGDTGTTDLFRSTPDYDGYSAEIGKYIFETTTLGIAYSQIDYTNSISDTLFDSDSDVLGLTFQHFGSFSEYSGYSIKANYGFLDLQTSEFDDLDDNPFDDSGEVYSFTFTFYPNRAWGIGLAYADSDDLGNRPYLTSQTRIVDGAGLFVDWSLTDRFSIRAMYTNSEYDLSEFDEIDEPGEVDRDSLWFGASLRL